MSKVAVAKRRFSNTECSGLGLNRNEALIILEAAALGRRVKDQVLLSNLINAITLAPLASLNPPRVDLQALIASSPEGRGRKKKTWADGKQAVNDE